MEFVKPIVDTDTIKILKTALKEHSARDYLLFVFAINTGLRISEMLKIEVKDIIENDKTPARFLRIRREDIFLNDTIHAALDYYFSKASHDSLIYLFQSSRLEKPITRQQAYRIMTQAAKEAGVERTIGPHTLRKTFGYHAYQKGIAVSLIQKRFHHASPAETRKYIGIEKNELIPKVDVNL